MDSPDTMTIWRFTPAVIRVKMYCIRNMRKRNHYAGISFTNDLGDIPCTVLRTNNKPALPVVNNRGGAYATRNRLRFMKKPTKFKGHME